MHCGRGRGLIPSHTFRLVEQCRVRGLISSDAAVWQAKSEPALYSLRTLGATKTLCRPPAPRRNMQFHGLLSRASDLVEMGFEKGREMGEAAAKVAADTAKAATDTAKAAADTAMAASSKSVIIEERQYLLISLIAEGGFAYVYRARDAASGEKVAVKKVLAQDRASAEIAYATPGLNPRLISPGLTDLLLTRSVLALDTGRRSSSSSARCRPTPTSSASMEAASSHRAAATSTSSPSSCAAAAP